MEDINLLILLLKRIDSDNSIYVLKEEYTLEVGQTFLLSNTKGLKKKMIYS